MTYNRINNLVGWLVFIIATFVYVSTMEPTASFWDCGEFISTSYKLMVPHPPGAPIFLLVGRFFSLFASDVQHVAYCVNLVSALSSSFTVLFLFWSITMIAKKLAKTEQGFFSTGQIISVMGAGVVGSLAYTFSDSAWFSAVEAEVYAMSSFFTAIVFWAILKWEAHSDEAASEKWLIFIAYLVGLSIGVHLLNLTAIPALAFVYYFKKYDKIDLKGSFIVLIISVLILGVVMVGIIPGLPTLASYFELKFVNSFGFGFGSGVFTFMFLLIGGLAYAIYYSQKTGKRLLNISLLSLGFILIGYFSYGIIVIRSHYNPPIDMNDPENVMTFTSYLKREQYGDRPLLKGPKFTAERPDYKKTSPIYTPIIDAKGKAKYIISDHKVEAEYAEKDKTLFPRMYSQQPGHPEQYRSWMGFSKTHVPTFGENLSFMFTYQMGHMYWRYFLWNFAGRMGDEQDSSWLGPNSWFSLDAETSLYASKARNNFFLLPLLAGMLGLSFQASRDWKNGTIVGILFFFTGLAIIIYLNQPPTEPRERDYTFAASFYAFSIWIGLSVMFFTDAIEKYILKNKTIAATVASLLLLSVPTIMASEGWDDHDRSKRYYQVESAKNLLNSCEKNAILFTGGDNDTYPLWYAQEVEGVRTDVRVCNLSLLNTDWYVKQMQSQAYFSDSLPIGLAPEQYRQGTNDYIYLDAEAFQKNKNAVINLPIFLDLVKKKDKMITRIYDGSELIVYPTQNFTLPVDTAYVKTLGIVPNLPNVRLVEHLDFVVEGSGMDKRTYVILNILSNNNWKRPVYFSSTLSPSDYIGLQHYMQLEGMAYRLLPAEMPMAREGWVNSEIMKNRMMKFEFTNLEGSSIFYDENYQRFTMNTKGQYHTLARQLMAEGKDAEAKAAILYCFNKIQSPAIPYDYINSLMVGQLFTLGEKDLAYKYAMDIKKFTEGTIKYLKADKIRETNKKRSSAYTLQALASVLQENGYKKEAEEIQKFLVDLNLTKELQ
ncbi:glycosyltransferase family 117 protein [Cytophaga aurantiaca]|uniref:glycosyltransferase family 117 protein n=1 Tax=Cytophaga aurantiaca TaxID=29530 RepID=UPI00036D80D4|nr:DUF2723 domain-containing protein [Cytophaga aurantiaca]